MFLYLILIFFSSLAFANEACINSFAGSQWAFQIQASRKFTNKALWPQFTSIQAEKALEAQWNQISPSPVTLYNSLLPQGARFIDHRLRNSHAPYLVKIPIEGSSLMLRLAYRSGNKDLQTNVLLNNVGFLANISPNKIHKDYLMGENVPVAIVFLHGGGTKSTGGHAAESLANRFAKYKVGVFSPDLPWHGEGPRVFMGDLEAEIQALSDLVKRYIHPEVPVFLWGHSWGASLANRVMQMSGEKPEGFFHNNLQGLIITSPSVDPAPGASYQTKKEAFEQLHSEYIKNLDKVPKNEVNIFRDIVYDGKTNPLGGLFTSLSISQIDDKLPSHRGDKFLPALMIVGTGDPLVYVGFEELFKNYYGQLNNVEAYFLDKLPLIQGNTEEKVGHLLGDYGRKGLPINFQLGHKFIEKITGLELDRVQENSAPIVKALGLYATDFSFREYVEEDFVIKLVHTQDFIDRKKAQNGYRQELNQLIRSFHPKSWLSQQLSLWLERLEQQQTQPDENFKSDLAEFKEELSKLKKLLPNVGSLIDSFNEEIPPQELILSIKAFRKGFSLKEVKSNKNAFRMDFFRAKKSGDLEEFWNTYFYITEAQRQSVEALLAKIQEIEQKTQHEYIPSAEELSQSLQAIESKKEADIPLPAIYYRWLEAPSPSQRLEIVSQIIEEIKANVELRREKKAEIFDLQVENESLIQTLQKQRIEIENEISQIKRAFRLANAQPPQALKERYEQSQQKFEELYELSKKLVSESNETWAYYLEKQIFDEKSLEALFEPPQIKGLIEEFNQKFQAYVEDRRKLRQELLEFLKAGGELQDQSYEKSVHDLYGELALYEVTNSHNIRLAEKEAQRHLLQKEQALLVNEYNDYLFEPAISYWEIHAIKDIFQQEFANTEIQRNLLLLALTQWNHLQSRILPSLPE